MTTIFGKLSGNTNSYALSTYGCLLGALTIIITMRPFSSGAEINSMVLFWSFLYALIPTAIGYLIYYIGVSKLTEVSKVPVIASVETIVASIIGVYYFKEILNYINILGIVLVIISIGTISYKSK